MKSLPAGWSTYIDGSWQVAYLIKITLVDTTVYRFGTMDTTSPEFITAGWTSDQYHGEIISQDGLGEVSYDVDCRRGGGLATVGNFQFKCLNQPDSLNPQGYFTSLFATKEFTNATVQVYRAMLEMSPEDEDDCVSVFKGIINDYTYDKGYAYFDCIIDESMHRPIPTKAIDERRFSSFTIPESTNGKLIPIQTGTLAHAEMLFVNQAKTLYELDTGIYQSVATGGDSNTLEDSEIDYTIDELAGYDLEIIGGTGAGQVYEIDTNLVNSINIVDTFNIEPADESSVYQVSDVQYNMIIADSEINEFTTDGTFELIYYWDDEVKDFIPFNARMALFYNNAAPFSGYAGIQFKNEVSAGNKITFYYPYPFDVYTGDAYDDPSLAFDFDNTTKATADDGDGSTPAGHMTGWFTQDLSDMIGTWDHLYVYAVWDHDASAANATAYMTIYNKAGTQKDSQNLTSSGNEFNSLPNLLLSPPSGYPDGANVVMFEVDDASATGVPAGEWSTLNYNRSFEANFRTVFGEGECNIHLYEYGLIFAKQKDMSERTRFFAAIKGREFGDTWGARKTSGNLVENPADVIEKILRTDLSVSGSNINTTEFDTVSGTDRSGWKLAYSIMDEINTLDEIKKICEESWLVYYINSSGKHTIKALASYVSVDKTLTLDDVLVDGDEVLWSVGKTPIEDVYNEIYVHYDKNSATGEYSGLAFIKDPQEAAYNANYVSTAATGSDLDSNEETVWGLAHESYTKYGIKRVKHIYLDRVVDAITADNILVMALTYFRDRKLETTLTTHLGNCDLEIGDVIQTLSPDMLTAISWVSGIRENLSEDTIQLKMIPAFL